MNYEPDLTIIISELMKQNYKRFGQWTTFDFTYNIVDSAQSFKVGCFVGLSFSRKIVPFGLVISKDETK